mgnify:CR=1 FL=1
MFKPQMAFYERFGARGVAVLEEAFLALKAKIPQIQAVEWGTNVSPEKHDKGFTHCFILVFDTGFKVVYKPKPLGLEVAFQQLMGWLNERGFEPVIPPVLAVVAAAIEEFTGPAEGSVEQALEAGTSFAAAMEELGETRDLIVASLKQRRTRRIKQLGRLVRRYLAAREQTV